MSRKRKKPSGDPRKNGAQAYRDAYRCGHCNGTIEDGPHGWAVGHQPGCPVLAGTAGNDAAGWQAAAAASEATGEPVVHGSWLAGGLRGNTTDAVKHQLGPRAKVILKRTAEMCLHKETCPHLDRARLLDGRTAVMVAHRPDIVLCPACYVADSQRISGTREDVTCDYCHVWQPEPPAGQTRIYSNQFHIPEPDLDITVSYGLCPGCWEADQSGAPV
jgi:hypothetical protein